MFKNIQRKEFGLHEMSNEGLKGRGNNGPVKLTGNPSFDTAGFVVNLEETFDQGKFIEETN